jgi:xanthine/uracil permease
MNLKPTQNKTQITFIWVETFPIHVYAPAILPIMIAYVVSTAESVPPYPFP